MTEKTFLEITDLPQDELNIFHGLRTPLIRVFNSCREHPYKMAAFKALIKFMYNTVVSYEKGLEKAEAAKATPATKPKRNAKKAATAA
jgi:hypothetical protein